MNIKTMLAAGLAALMLFGGTAAALPGNAPADAGANDDANATDERADDGETARGPPTDVGSQGPPTDMPEQVPDHVSQIHDLVGQFLSGDLDGSLGDAISDVTPEESTDDNATATPA